MRLALYQLDILQNCGALIRLGAGLGVGVDIIEPCGFLFNDKKLRRAGMDYLEHAEIVRHPSWQAFLQARSGVRLVLFTTKGAGAGTGLGLYNSWRIVQLHHGHIRADARPGEWAEFTFEIPQPLCAADVADELEPSE